MTTGEKLLNLTIEYKASTDARDGEWTSAGTPDGREPSVIAAEYETAIRDLLS